MYAGLTNPIGGALFVYLRITLDLSTDTNQYLYPAACYDFPGICRGPLLPCRSGNQARNRARLVNGKALLCPFTSVNLIVTAIAFSIESRSGQ